MAMFNSYFTLPEGNSHRATRSHLREVRPEQASIIFIVTLYHGISQQCVFLAHGSQVAWEFNGQLQPLIGAVNRTGGFPRVSNRGSWMAGVPHPNSDELPTNGLV